MSIKTKIDGARAVMAFDNWPALFLGRLLYRKTGLVVYCKDNLEILVDDLGGDEAGTRKCIVSDMYRKYVPIQASGTCAGSGHRRQRRWISFDAAAGRCQLASVVSVEMNPATYSRLLVNLQSNIGPSAVAMNAAACGTETGPEIPFAASRGSTGYSMGENSVGGTVIKVKTTTFESLYDQYFAGGRIDICKIDIEGAEYDLLDSSPDDLLRRIRYLLIGFHDDSKTLAVIRRFAELGFSELTESSSRRTGAQTEVRFFRGPLPGA